MAPIQILNKFIALNFNDCCGPVKDLEESHKLKIK